MMGRSHLIGMFAFLIGCRAPSVANTPVITVDQPHSHLTGESDPEGAHYTLPEGDAFVLDASTFDFSKAPYTGQAPNSVQLVLAEDQAFRTTLPPNRKAILDRSTLIPIRGSAPFRGFRKGQTAVVAVGVTEINAVEKKIMFNVQWAGMIDVTSSLAQR